MSTVKVNDRPDPQGTAVAPNRAARRRARIAVATLPLTAVVFTAGVAYGAPTHQPGVTDPEQPGLTAPREQPGVTPSAPTPQALPAPVEVDEMPLPPIVNRPRPQQQTQPYIPQPRPQVQPSQPQEQKSDEETVVETPLPPIINPRLIRVGTEIFEAPEWVPTPVVHDAQAASDWTEWQVAGAFDAVGYSREASDHRAAATLAGGVGGAAVGAAVAYPVPMLVGCGVGAVAGGLIGAGIGTLAAPATVGVAIPLGAVIGAGVGCVAGSVVVGVPAAVLGAAVGGAAGAALGAAMGGKLDERAADPEGGQQTEPVPAPAPAPVPAPMPIPDPVEIVTEVADQATTVVADSTPQVQTVLEDVSASSPAGEQAVNTLRDAVAEMPMLDPNQVGAGIADPINSVLGAVQAAVLP
ncbi:Uncharacterised protein [Nocardia otitidiscaviarum]|uniref:Glycine zipper domain-containing protein n=1 Tax=Nocardia otitidiscaviarum TaxID=1823 RepID=A0A379JNH7_9NOCA|nr:Uncharacterised protein [Nocardia otitidiscaviarum]